MLAPRWHHTRRAWRFRRARVGEQERYRYCSVFRLSHPEVMNHAQAALSTARRSFSERCLAVDMPALEIVR